MIRSKAFFVNGESALIERTDQHQLDDDTGDDPGKYAARQSQPQREELESLARPVALIDRRAVRD